ncbi:hypothetical protein K432DRAFT_7869 [Lepidopterella palustris CBS 459.81]|uniref:Uncharacterized protein n=1 Tax=Lepidopterella palustris CBS 459.81 TaxID=1314670 RepID=A0A8E2J900_9PEZI|nr:hypothetical protein K432DRAFT_7869 [Lepidopterella palustris CBS 459.81]
MAVTKADLENRWQNSTTVTFGNADKKAIHHFDATTSERTFACESCEEILFIDGDGSTLFRAGGSGQMKLPSGIMVRAKGGSAKCL